MGERERGVRGDPTIPPARDLLVARWGVVSWLRAARLAFPVAQWLEPNDCLPVTVAGPRRSHTGFRDPESLTRRVYRGPPQSANAG